VSDDRGSTEWACGDENLPSRSSGAPVQCPKGAASHLCSEFEYPASVAHRPTRRKPGHIWIAGDVATLRCHVSDGAMPNLTLRSGERRPGPFTIANTTAPPLRLRGSVQLVLSKWLPAIQIKRFSFVRRPGQEGCTTSTHDHCCHS
jgi:hypothetical protein